MKNEIEQIAQQNKMSIEFVTWFFNKKKSACGEHWFLMLGAMWEGWKGRSIEMDRLAAENAALKAFGDKLNKMYDDLNGEGSGWQGRAEVVCQQEALGAAMEEFDAIETPATDRIVAGIKADGVEMFALMFAEEAIKDNNITTGWKAKASRAASEYAELLREGAKC
ncbi:hypothetical protein QTP03_24310 [Klebsiella michiganensis]|nr:hypothetical protein [Klebsiella michiganensis]MDM4569651.1 hypothetical protein [Klebsiella michiganensis]MDM4585471.1 hypothetical protein [Klebsiella michiganensis]DAN16259.1 MAG TPA: protein of unknown function (DUF5490) [Caudoviricetes sp.]